MHMEGMPIMELHIMYYYFDISFSNIVTIISNKYGNKSNSLKQKQVSHAMPILALMSKQSAVSVWFKVNFI